MAGTRSKLQIASFQWSSATRTVNRCTLGEPVSGTQAWRIELEKWWNLGMGIFIVPLGKQRLQLCVGRGGEKDVKVYINIIYIYNRNQKILTDLERLQV